MMQPSVSNQEIRDAWKTPNTPTVDIDAVRRHVNRDRLRIRISTVTFAVVLLGISSALFFPTGTPLKEVSEEDLAWSRIQAPQLPQRFTLVEPEVATANLALYSPFSTETKFIRNRLRDLNTRSQY